uniref:MAGUK p55 subfamily member 7-like n=1 Tax=Cynoglossus semilaevis TaxID=244447 RepID=A0A3P8WLI2_CYNSE
MSEKEMHTDTEEDYRFLHSMLVEKKLHLLFKVRNVLLCVHDAIAQRDFDPSLPPAPDDALEEEDGAFKIVSLVKTKEPLGMTIRRNETTGAVVVARILRGGAADKSDLIHEGDELKEVNGVLLKNRKPEEILSILAQSPDSVTFTIIPAFAEESTSPCERKVQKETNVYPDRDPAVPCRDAALSFKRGEILQIVCMEDVNWWQACHLKDSSGRGGLIPSQQLQERDAKNRQRLVVLAGPNGVGLNELKKRLLLSDPDRFGVSVSRKSDCSQFHVHVCLLFIEYWRYKDHYYGTSLDSIHEVIAQGKVCLLDVHPSVSHVYTCGFKPYVVFVKPPCIEELRLTRRRAKSIRDKEDTTPTHIFAEEDFKDMIHMAEIMENQHGHLFDKVIVNGDMAVGLRELKADIERMLKAEVQWIPVVFWLH